MKWAQKLWWTFVLMVVVGCGSSESRPPTPTKEEIHFFMGVQLGGGAQDPLRTRPMFPGDYCNVTDRQGPAEPPAPFLYQPFEGSFNGQSWTAQMDHDQPVYRQNGVIATLGEILRYDVSGPGLAGGTEAYGASGKQWFGPDVSYAKVLQQGYHILAYQSPSFETYLYYDGHDGHDFAVTGKALAAADGGVVFKGDYSNGLGRVVEIYHPNGYLTRYAHLASFESGITVGTQVKAGQPIGTIGGSAVVDGKLIDNYWGTHLHFSVFRWTGSEWHITDPFGWDPWAGPDPQSHLRKQKEDPLTHCNGEVSYNLWVGGWPQPVSKTIAATPFYPTQDRYVGGWLGEPPVQGGESGKSPAPLPVIILPFDYQEKEIGDGWKVAGVRLYFVNTSGHLLPPQTLHVTNILVETLEKRTYPARLLTLWSDPNPGHQDILDDYLRAEEWNAEEPKEIFLGGVAEGSHLGIPPHFPFRNAPMGLGSVEYAIGFRFAEAAHPVRIILHFDSFSDVSIDLLSTVRKSIPDPSPDEVKAQPLKNLPNPKIDNSNVSFTWDGTCVWRIEGLVENKMVYLPYTFVNKNAFDEEEAIFNFPHAVYEQGGRIFYWEESQQWSIGPGQTERGLYLIDLLMTKNDPMPLYLIHYSDDKHITVFQLRCTYQE